MNVTEGAFIVGLPVLVNVTVGLAGNVESLATVKLPAMLLIVAVVIVRVEPEAFV